jgi:hypothetical protein
VDRAHFDRAHLGPGSNVRATPLAEDLGTVIGQARIDLRHEPVARLEQDKPDLVPVDVLVKRRDLVRERSEFAEQLHADQSAADDDNSQVAALAVGISLSVGPLEPLDDVVAQQQSVSDGLECEGVLRAGDHFPVGPRAHCQDKLVIAQFTHLSPVGQMNHAAV